ncbi:hypothetical protein HMI56_004902 [Coelomomyces lativittatus]|nr:hypothetical protein HMI56_004902 [Coelomomyces lativittatus]
MQSILPISENSPFTIENIPFGIFSPTKKDSPRVGVALGDYVFDLAVAADHGVFQSMSMLSSKAKEVFHQVRKVGVRERIGDGIGSRWDPSFPFLVFF